MGVNVEERGGERGSGWESEWDVREGEWGGRERERESVGVRKWVWERESVGC